MLCFALLCFALLSNSQVRIADNSGRGSRRAPHVNGRVQCDHGIAACVARAPRTRLLFVYSYDTDLAALKWVMQRSKAFVMVRNVRVALTSP